MKIHISGKSGYLSIEYVGTKLLKIGYIITEITICYIGIYIIIKYMMLKNTKCSTSIKL